MKININKKGVQFLIIFFTILLVYILYSFAQAPISYNEGKGWDGISYYSIAEKFCQNSKIIEQGPFVNRIGTPFLVSFLIKLKVTNSILTGFKIINIIASLICALLLYYWLLINNIKFIINYIVNLIFITTWIGPLRFTLYYPAFVDPLFLMCILSGIILIELYSRKKKIYYIFYLSGLSFFGVLIRESYIIIPISLLFINNPFNFKIKPQLKSVNKKLSIFHDLIFKIIKFKKFQIYLFVPLLFSLLAFVLV